MSEIQVQENIARASDILEQITKLNQMVEFHRKSGELSMMRQYDSMRGRFLKELESILNGFQIRAKIVIVKTWSDSSDRSDIQIGRGLICKFNIRCSSRPFFRQTLLFLCRAVFRKNVYPSLPIELLFSDHG